MHPERKQGVELRVGTVRHTDGWRVKEAAFGVFMTAREEVVPCNGKPVGLFSQAHLTILINNTFKYSIHNINTNKFIKKVFHCVLNFYCSIIF